MDLEKALHSFKYEDADDDDQLKQYFVRTRSFLKLKDERTAVLVGQYGSGKTAIMRYLVDRRTAGKDKLYIVPIGLRVDIFGEELKAARSDKAYATFWESLLYLHLIYGMATQASGTLKSGSKAKLIRELSDLDLSPYGDVISRLGQAALGLVKGIKKVEVPKVFGIERFDPEPKAVDLNRYRTFCAKVRPLVITELGKRKALVVVDNVDAPPYLAVETGHLVGALIRWLKDFERSIGDAVSFFLGLPTALSEVMKRIGDHQPTQDIFHWLRWDKEEFEELILERLGTAMAEDEDPREWIEQQLGVTVEGSHEWTFGRPRDYVKLMRCLLEERRIDPDAAASDVWRRGCLEYCRQVLHWLGEEWYSNDLDKWDEIIGALSEVEPPLEGSDMKDILEPIRADAHERFRRRSIRAIVRDLEEWGLLVRSQGKSFNVHQTIRGVEA